MAIQIIPKLFRRECSRCHAELTYEVQDLVVAPGATPYIVCPICKAILLHDAKYEDKGNKGGDDWGD